jgi:hypothetical protein
MYEYIDVSTDETLLGTLITQATKNESFARPTWTTQKLLSKIGQWNPKVISEFFRLMANSKEKNILTFKSIKDA